jgi:dihydrofolate reductase
MRKLAFGMNVSLDGYIAAPDGDLGWSVPSDELFQWWSDRVGASGLALYGRRLWETPVLVGGGTPFFTHLDSWVNLTLVETRTFPDGVVLTRYETRR